MRRNEHCLNSTVDMRMQERSYTSHIMKLRNIKSSINTSKPQSPLHFYSQQEEWEKNRHEVHERSNLIRSRQNTSRMKNGDDNKSVNYGLSSRISSRPSSSYSSSKILTKSRSPYKNNYSISNDSQVFLTQSNLNTKRNQSPKKKEKKTKVDSMLSNLQMSQFAESEGPESYNTSKNNQDYISDETKSKKNTRSPYCPAAKQLLKKQKMVSSMFNKRFLRTALTLNPNNCSEFNYETESECAANITDDNINSNGNSILKTSGLFAKNSVTNNRVEFQNRGQMVNNNKIQNNSITDSNSYKDKIDQSESDFLSDDFCKSESMDISENSNGKNDTDNVNRDDFIHESDDVNNPIKKKRKKVIKKKIRKIKVVRQPQSETLNEISLSDN